MAIAALPIAFTMWTVATAQFAPDRLLAVDLIRHTTLHVWCLASLVLLAALALALRRPPAPRRRWLAIAAVLLPPWLYAAGVATPWRIAPLRHNQQAAPEQSVRVLVWNVLETNRQHVAVQRAIERVDADVVAIIECSESLLKSLEPLRGRYPYWSPEAGGPPRGIVVFSRVPDTRFREVPTAGAAVAVETQWAASPESRPHKTLFVHTTSPRRPDRVEQRDAELAAVGRWAAEHAAAPAIVAGDLNTTPYTPVFRQLLRAGSLEDSRAYRGHFATWHAAMGDFGIPIDHALVNRHVRVSYRGVAEGLIGSDHRGVVIELE